MTITAFRATTSRLLVLLLAAVGAAFAQSAQVTGRVTDQTGAIVPKADVVKPEFPAVIETKGGAHVADAPLPMLRIAPAAASAQSRGLYVPGYREEFVFGDDPYRYFRW